MFRIVILVALVGFCESQYNWCNVAGCGNQHIACKNDGQFQASCIQPSQVPLTDSLKAQIVRKHNQYRSNVALGNVTHLKSARRMAQMEWDNQLAFLAELNTKQCRMQHDACHNTQNYKYSGQNLGVVGTTSTHYQPQAVIEMMTEMWYNESQLTTQNDIDRFTRLYSGSQPIGHFTSLVNDRQTAVGCAISRYVSNGYNYSLMACNYASTNIMNRPVYTTGSVGSGCTKGRDTTFPGLCKTTESIDPNSL